MVRDPSWAPGPTNSCCCQMVRCDLQAGLAGTKAKLSPLLSPAPVAVLILVQLCPCTDLPRHPAAPWRILKRLRGACHHCTSLVTKVRDLVF